jgi:hypothetical protein
MSYEISLSEDQSYICIRLDENITGDLQKAFAAESIALAQEHGISNFFADLRGISNNSPVIDQYQLSYKDLDLLHLDKSSRIAALVSSGDSSHNFIETVMRNAGYNFQLFTDEQQAIDWLGQES